MAKNLRKSSNHYEKQSGEKWYEYPRPSQRLALVKEAHRVCGHGRFTKTLNLLRLKYFWEGMDMDVQDYLQKCMDCARFKPPSKQFTFTLFPPVMPFHKVFIDIVGPLPRTFNGNKFLIIAIDHFTKWI